MSHWEAGGKSDDWYTPHYIFEAMRVVFDLDVAAPPFGTGTFVPTNSWISHNSLDAHWSGFIWMNPPFGGRNGLEPWMDKFFDHRNGVALTPDRTSAPWWQKASKQADALLFVGGKIKFVRPDGTEGKSPSNGTTLFASGQRGVAALMSAASSGLGTLCLPARV